MLCEHVECDYFQDGRAFLLGDGQMGRQPGILPGGASYDINPWLFEVLTVDTIGAGRHGLTAADLQEISIPEGSTGVVIALEGAPPDEDDEDDGAVGRRVSGHGSFQFPWVFLDNGGQRGAQAETLSHGGVYRINPWFARIVLIPTRELTLEWSKKDSKSTGNYDAALDQIVVNVEGHRLRFDMSQTIRTPAKAAPRLVGRFGEQETDPFGSSDATNPAPVQRFVERVLGYTVEGYFQGTASEYTVLEFIAAQNEVCLEIGDRVREALAYWGVEAGRTTLGTFESEGMGLDELRREIVAERERNQVLEHREKNVVLEARAERIRIETDRERRKTEAAELEAQVEILGKDAIAMERFLAQLAKMGVPEFVGGDANALLQYMPLPAAQEMINRAMRRIETEADTTAPQQLNAASGSDNADAEGTDTEGTDTNAS